MSSAAQFPVSPALTDGRSRSVAFCSPYCLFDGSSGAALSMRAMLKGLAGRGWSVSSLSSTIYDSPNGWNGLHAALAPQHGLSTSNSKTISPLTIKQDGGVHSVLQTSNWKRFAVSAIEEQRFVAVFAKWLETTRPAVVLSFGGMLLEAEIRRRVRAKGIASVFYLVNASYQSADTFENVDLAITDTTSTAALYRERLGLELYPVGKFIDRESVVAPSSTAEYVTFINPAYTKGAGLFCAIAKLALQRLPNVRFLVVESRSTWSDALAGLGLKPIDLPNVHFTAHTTDMRQIYARTRLLLLPSLWHESGARVIAEAQLNGIPVLATDRGGNAEMVGKGGHIFTAPARLVSDNRQLANADEVYPWVSRLAELCVDGPEYQTLREATLEAGGRFDIDGAVDRLEHVFGQLAN
jgi:glycosyltransferase involved in cell wall biosynthesis